MKLKDTQNEEVVLFDKPIGRGGEGNVYEIKSPEKYQDFVLKLYHEKERTKIRELKIIYLLANRPDIKDNLSVIWPEELVYSEDKFVGFLMPKVKNAIDLTSLCTLNLPYKLDEQWHYLYDRNKPLSLNKRLEICQRLANTINQIHKSGKYVLVDLKPENIKVTVTGQISIIDIDSIEVIPYQKVIFPADKTSPEYSPPERKELNLKSDYLPVQWDLFSLGIVFYKILFGLHPYAGSCIYPFDKLRLLEEKIQQGLFPMGANSDYFSVIPEPHKNFETAPEVIQNLFLACFDDAFSSPEKRPDAEQWSDVFRTSFFTSAFPYKYVDSKPAKIRRWTPTTISYVKGAAIVVSFFSLSLFSALNITAIKVSDEKVTLLTEDQQKMKSIKELEKTYGFMEQFKDGLSKTQQNDKYGFINRYGEKGVDFKYEWADNFKEGMARVGVEGKYGFVNDKGEEKIPLKYDFVGSFHEGLAKIVFDDKTGYTNQNGDQIVAFKYDYGGNFTNGFAKVKLDGKWGFINSLGQQIVPMLYDDALNFNEGLAAVKWDKHWGYIDTNGKVIIPNKFSWASGFIEDRAIVKIGDIEYNIDPSGKIIGKNY